MTGIFATRFLVESPQMLATYGFGQTAFRGIIALIALTICTLMNYFVWYVSWLIRRGYGFSGLAKRAKKYLPHLYRYFFRFDASTDIHIPVINPRCPRGTWFEF